MADKSSEDVNLTPDHQYSPDSQAYVHSLPLFLLKMH